MSMEHTMSKTIITTENAPAAVGPYSQAVVAGNFVFCAGQIPLTPEGELVTNDVRAQTRQVLKNLKAVLLAAGARLEDVVKTTVYLSNIQNFAEFNEVYAEFFSENPPARATIESPHLPKGALIEIECIALIS